MKNISPLEVEDLENLKNLISKNQEIYPQKYLKKKKTKKKRFVVGNKMKNKEIEDLLRSVKNE